MEVNAQLYNRELRQVIHDAYLLRRGGMRKAGMYICPAQRELHGTPVQR